MSVERPQLAQIQEEDFNKLKKALDDYFFRLNDAVNTLAPPGSIAPFVGNAVPTGWVLCDGTEYDRNKFPELFKAIGTTWGSSGAGVFAVPDLRGKILYGSTGGYPLAAAGPIGATGAGLPSVAIYFIIKV